jgi:glycerophosphoryl diester phosphodiesterase
MQRTQTPVLPYPAGRAGQQRPVIVLAYAYSGAARVQRLLSGSAVLACTSGTGLLPLCDQAAAAWRRVDNRAGPLSSLAASSIRSLAGGMISIILAEEGKPRWCEISSSPPAAAETFLQLYPGTRFVCLHRSCPDVIRAGIEANPWGLTGTGFAPFAVAYPGSSAAAIAAYWADRTEPLLRFQEAHPAACRAVRYDDLAGHPDREARDISAFLELSLGDTTRAVHLSYQASGHTTIVRVPYLDHPRPVAFAHRGGAAHAPENSPAAFEYAVKLGYAYLETDARATSDGKLVTFHDRTLDRVTDGSGPIGVLPYRDVAALRIAGSEPIPLIEDLLGAWPDVRFNIDLKDEPGIALLPGVLRRTGAWDRVCLTSFSGSRLRAARRLLDRPVCMTPSPAAIAAIRCFGAVPRAPHMRLLAARLAHAGARCAQVPGRVATGSFLRRSHALGLDVHVWTINDRAEMIRFLDLGVDGVMTDDIVTLRDVLIERGQWHPRTGG